MATRTETREVAVITCDWCKQEIADDAQYIGVSTDIGRDEDIDVDFCTNRCAARYFAREARLAVTEYFYGWPDAGDTVNYPCAFDNYRITYTDGTAAAAAK